MKRKEKKRNINIDLAVVASQRFKEVVHDIYIVLFITASYMLLV